MDNNSKYAEFLCHNCEHGHYFRVAKEVIPYRIVYTCGPFEGPRGPGGWDGKTCPNFVESKEKDPMEGCEIMVTHGRLDKSILVVDAGTAKENKV
jgi:hypothetical protein